MQLSSLSEWIGGEDDDDVVIAGPLSRRQRLPPLSVSQPGHADYYDAWLPMIAERMLIIWAVLLDAALAASMNASTPGVEGASCPGSISLGGRNRPIHMTNAYWNKPYDPAGEVDVDGNGVIHVYMKGRTYFSDKCRAGSYSNNRYTKLRLLGKRIRWTTDLATAGCGCNAAFYLVSLAQNTEVSGCKDYYCDANSVCGVRCTEIDLQEANKHAFHSVLHLAQDGSGEGLGYGGGGSGWSNSRDWTKEEYGPGLRGGEFADTRPTDLKHQSSCQRASGASTFEIAW
eukprot:g12769.t1